MNDNYNNLVTQSFRDNSIRSVTIIDDQIIPYHSLVKEIQSRNLRADATATQGAVFSSGMIDLKESINASLISEFFLSKKILCDIDNAAENIDHEKIRKSDLIILDYHLVPGDSTKSRELIYNISNTPHMNLVVVYTTDELKRVWKEISLSLLGAVDKEFDKHIEDLWDELCNGEIIPASFEGIITEEELLKVPFEGNLSKSAIRLIARLLDGDNKKYAKDIGKKLLLEFMHRNLGITTKYIEREILGSDSDKPILWLQVGSVFITFYKKGESDNPEDEAQHLWQRINDALIDWGPSYYQLMLSEIQNRLEDQNLPMDKLISKGKYEQSSMLWSMLHGIQSNSLENPIQIILRNIHDYLFNYSLADSGLKSFLVSAAEAVEENLPNSVKLTFSPGSPVPTNKSEYDAYQDELVNISLSNYFASKSYKKDVNDRLYIVHAFNKELSTTEIKSKFITTGMLFKDKETGSWYLCVSPSCNTVAGQLTDKASKRMTPHRAMRFLELEKCNLTVALESATQSKYIFACDGGRAVALSVVHSVTNLPIIEIGIVHDHDGSELTSAGKTVSFIAGPSGDTKIEFDDKVLIPMGQVKESYAARFQNIQSHYEGRIGVDFVSL